MMLVVSLCYDLAAVGILRVREQCWLAAAHLFVAWRCLWSSGVAVRELHQTGPSLFPPGLWLLYRQSFISLY